MKLCRNCMYRVPVMTSRGTYNACLCPESERMYKAVNQNDTCKEWCEYTEEDDNGMQEL